MSASHVPSKSDVHLMLVVGEPSGDAIGAQLIAALNKLRPSGLTITGVGGPLMEAQGLKSLFSLADTSVMGLKEVVPKIPRILKRVEEAADHAVRTRPDLVVLIDSPDFTHRIARRLKRLAPHLTIVKYVAPQVWASRPWRAKKLSEFVDHLLALLPFEPEFFERYGVRTHFVGHPVMERVPAADAGIAADFRTRHGIALDAPLLVLLPGSRTNEIRYLFPEFAGTVALLKERLPDLRVVLPTVHHVRRRVEEAAAELAVRPVIVESESEKFAAFRAGTAALAASGTVSTELALAGTSMVIGYKLGWLTAMIVRPLFKMRYFTLLNIIADEMIIPELLQEECTPETLLGALLPLMTSEGARQQQISKTADALRKLGVGGEAPSLRAARTVLEIADQRA